MITLEFKRFIKEGKKRVFKAPVESQQQAVGAKEVGSIVASSRICIANIAPALVAIFLWRKALFSSLAERIIYTR